ncbi:hypothetical protein TcG_11730 [Trypanosoma cruzi]|nr:hypothetical protein TcG_11730 [Trypanosoma cruzi]
MLLPWRLAVPAPVRVFYLFGSTECPGFWFLLAWHSSTMGVNESRRPIGMPNPRELWASAWSIWISERRPEAPHSAASISRTVTGIGACVCLPYDRHLYGARTLQG